MGIIYCSEIVFLREGDMDESREELLMLKEELLNLIEIYDNGFFNRMAEFSSCMYKLKEKVKREEVSASSQYYSNCSKCILCDGTGVVDSGGQNPDGSWIEIPCQCINGSEMGGNER